MPQYGEGFPILFNGLDISISFNPFRNLGYASPGLGSDAVTNVSEITGVLRKGVIGSATLAYAVGGTDLNEITISTSAIINDGDFPHEISATTAALDCIKYNDGTNDFIYYSWNDGTNGDIGRYQLGTSTFDDTYWDTTLSQTALSKAYEHPIVVGDDDVLYFGDGNVLKSIDQTTANDNALTLPRDKEIISFAKLGNNTLVIFAHNKINSQTINYGGTVTAYFWDYLNSDPYRVERMEGGLCGGAFEYKGTIGVFTSGISSDFNDKFRNTKMFLYNGSEFEEQFAITLNGGLNAEVPLSGGIEVLGSFIMFNLGGVLYSYGSPFIGIKGGLHQLANVNSTGKSGMLKTFLSGSQLMSSDDTGNTRLLLFNAGKFITNTNIRTTYAEPFFETGTRGKVTKVRVEYYDIVPGSTGAFGVSLDLDLRDRDGTTINVINDKFTNSKLTEDHYSDTNGGTFKQFDSLQLNLNWGSGDLDTKALQIRKVIVDFELVNISN